MLLAFQIISLCGAVQTKRVSRANFRGSPKGADSCVTPRRGPEAWIIPVIGSFSGEFGMSRSNRSRESSRLLSGAAILSAGVLCALLSACSGTTGSPGPPGATGTTSPPGTTTTGSALNVSTATTITGTITGVTVNGPPVVKFGLVDENGAPLQGLPAADLGWVIAQLVPGQNGTSSQWNSYIVTTVTPAACPAGVAACKTAPRTKATVETTRGGPLGG